MTECDLAELLTDCPNLYHMAEQGSWQSIQTHGLMSTTALLDHYGISGRAREQIQDERRPKSIRLESNILGNAIVRDQLPMDDGGLRRCLQDDLLPIDWYRILNAKVFFWLTRERLLRLLNAGTYRLKEHDVLVLDAKALVEAYQDKIWLCPINSGCTKPFPHPRGRDTFQRITEYPYVSWRSKRKSGERVVELAVDYAIPDVVKFVSRVIRMQATQEISVLFERSL